MVFPEDNEDQQQFLSHESRKSLELCTKIRKQCQQVVLNGQGEEQVMTVVDLMENMQRGWRAASGENAQLREQNGRLKRQIENFETALAEARDQNQRLQSERAADQALIAALQLELDQYKERFSRARTELQNAALGKQPGQKMVTLVAPPDEDTGEDDAFGGQERGNQSAGNGLYEGGGGRVGKRRSNSLGVLPDKKAKRLMEQQQDSMERLAEEDDIGALEMLPQQQPMVPNRLSRQRAMNRSMSEGRLFDEKREIAKQHEQQMQKQTTINKFAAISSLDMHLSPATAVGFGSGWTKGRPIEQCGHNFSQVNKWFGAAFCHCSVCMRGLGARGLKCSDCKLQIHENCRPNAPFPCVPMIATPQRNNPKQRPRLADLCHESPPKIPGQLIRCVVALERGFLGTVGLYRVPGCDSEVKKLKENFNSKYAPKLDQLDPETITGYIKKFLRDLREPLIPFSSYKEFCNAVARQDEAQLKYAIETLPIPNRDTLAFLCAHWQKVAMRSNENQMPLENLAKVLGPTVVGTSSKLTHLQPQNGTPTSTNSPMGGGDAARHYQEAGRQCEILFTLLNLDHSYWTAFYNSPSPAAPLAPTSTLLGSGSRGNTPGTPRCGGTATMTMASGGGGGHSNSNTNTPGTSTASGSTLVRRQPPIGTPRGGAR